MPPSHSELASDVLSGQDCDRTAASKVITKGISRHGPEDASNFVDDIKAKRYSGSYSEKSQGERSEIDARTIARFKDENIRLQASLLSARQEVEAHKLQLQKTFEERARLQLRLEESEVALASLSSSSDVASTTSSICTKALCETVTGHLTAMDEMQRSLSERTAEVDKLSDLASALNSDLRRWQQRYDEAQMKCESAEFALAQTRERLVSVEQSLSRSPTEGSTLQAMVEHSNENGAIIPRMSLLTSCLMQTEQRLQEAEGEMGSLQHELAETREILAESQLAYCRADVENMVLKQNLDKVTRVLEQRVFEAQARATPLQCTEVKDVGCQAGAVEQTAAPATAVDAACQLAGGAEVGCQPDLAPDPAAAAVMEAPKQAKPEARKRFGLIWVMKHLVLHGSVAVAAVLVSHSEAGRTVVKRFREAAGLDGIYILE